MEADGVSQYRYTVPQRKHGKESLTLTPPSLARQDFRLLLAGFLVATVQETKQHPYEPTSSYP